MSKPHTEEQINHPAHYGGADDPYEAIKVIEAWGLGFLLGNTLKYIARYNKQGLDDILPNLKKARWYLDRQIEQMEEPRGQPGTQIDAESTKQHLYDWRVDLAENLFTTRFPLEARDAQVCAVPKAGGEGLHACPVPTCPNLRCPPGAHEAPTRADQAQQDALLERLRELDQERRTITRLLENYHAGE